MFIHLVNRARIIFQTFEIFLLLTITYFYNFAEDVLCHEFASLALVSMAGNYILHTDSNLEVKTAFIN